VERVTGRSVSAFDLAENKYSGAVRRDFTPSASLDFLPKRSLDVRGALRTPPPDRRAGRSVTISVSRAELPAFFITARSVLARRGRADLRTDPIPRRYRRTFAAGRCYRSLRPG
jgi:hypothetical protein